MNKEYLGDGVYASYDGFGIDLTTEDGISTTNRIYLEPAVFYALGEWWEHIMANRRKPAAPLKTALGEALKPEL